MLLIFDLDNTLIDNNANTEVAFETMLTVVDEWVDFTIFINIMVRHVTGKLIGSFRAKELFIVFMVDDANLILYSGVLRKKLNGIRGFIFRFAVSSS